MEFKRAFRGYDVNEVDRYIAETADKEKKIRLNQRERIDELSDENYLLREELNRYKADEQAIIKSLVASRNLAHDVELSAEEYADKVLIQAKKFYATWQTYAKTLVATLTEDELKAFNELQRRLEDVIDSYQSQRKDINVKEESTPSDDRAVVAAAAEQVAEIAARGKRQSAAKPQEVKEKSAKQQTARSMQNPISKVEDAAEAVIDLRELTRTDQSLEELCADLGLIGHQ